MKPLSNKISTILCLFLIFTNFLMAQEQIMKLGYLSNNTIEGQLDPILDQYYAHILAPAMGVKVEWVGPLPFTRILQYLKSGKLDMFYCMAKNEERKKYISFTTTPSWHDKVPMVVKKDSPLESIKEVEDLYDYRIGYCLEMIKPSFFNEPEVQIENISGDNWGVLNLRKLLMGRIDIALFPSISMLNGFKKTLDKDINFEKEFRLIYPPNSIMGEQMGGYFDGFSKASTGRFYSKYKEAIKEVGVYWDYYDKHK